MALEADKLPILFTTIVYSNTSPLNAITAGSADFVIFLTDFVAVKLGLKVGVEQDPISYTPGDAVPIRVPDNVGDEKSIE